MKKIKKALKIIRNILIGLIIILLIFLLIRFIGIEINRKVPDGGINESMYVEINGEKQWISIYGKDKDNPVLLYLHGGPGSSTSAYDYAFTRKWTDIYTVVTWDQRNCGKSYDKSQNDIELTYDLMMSDGLEMTRYLLDYLDKDKLTILGHSWGTYLGANLVLKYPEYYDCYIGTGQLVDMHENEIRFRKEAAKWVGNDEDGLKLLEKLDTDVLTPEYLTARNQIMVRYNYDLMADGTDYNLYATEIFNPYYSILDWINCLNVDSSVYLDFILSKEFEKFSLLGKLDYKVPYYNINGNRDYQTNYELAQEYFDQINAPYKEMYIMKNTTHGLLESKSTEFSEILHKITADR